MGIKKLLSVGLIVWGAYNSRAQDIFSAGARGGASFNGNTQRFKQTEIFSELNLPWDWTFHSGWRLRSRLDISLGALDGEDKIGFIGTAGPVLELGHTNFPIVADIGFSPTVLSRYEFGGKDFGDYLQFTSHIGVTWNITEHLSLGYRLQHMSNGGIACHNPGLNEQVVSLGYRF